MSEHKSIYIYIDWLRERERERFTVHLKTLPAEWNYNYSSILAAISFEVYNASVFLWQSKYFSR